MLSCICNCSHYSNSFVYISTQKWRRVAQDFFLYLYLCLCPFCFFLSSHVLCYAALCYAMLCYAALYCREGYRRMCRDGKIDTAGEEEGSTSLSLFGSRGAISSSGQEGGLGLGLGEDWAAAGSTTTDGTSRSSGRSCDINDEFS